MGLRGTIAIWLGASLSGLAATPTPTPTPARPAWENTVTTLSRGNFTNPRPFVATYNFGWNGIIAATGEIKFDQRDDHLQVVADGQTVGLARALWKFNVHHRALAEGATFRPLEMHQVETTRRKTVTTDLTFKPNRVDGIRTNVKSIETAKTRTYSSPKGVLDMFSTMLYLRSQPLRVGDAYRLIVYPASSPYLATLTVADQSSIKIAAGTYPALKLDLQLSRIGKKGELGPHKKFRHASLWVSDDADRILLRVEAGIFVGTVFAELQSIRFPNDRP